MILRDLLASRGHLLLDGATGTQLFARGLTSGDSPERWNLERPEAIVAMHREYVGAGSDLILTNTFGGSASRLALHALQDQVGAINHAAAVCARTAADAAKRTVVVAGSIGPSGELLQPLGPRTVDELTDAFADQAAGLASGGVDVFWIETMSHLDEVAAAVAGCRRAAPGLPVVATCSFDTAGRTMMGVTGAAFAAAAAELDLAAFGANCGATIAQTEAAVCAMVAHAGGRLVVSKPNAGIPQWGPDGLVYDGTPDVMAAHGHRAHAAGAHLVGGCCGSTPEHLALMRAVLDGLADVPDVEVPELDLVAAGAAGSSGARGDRAGRRRRG